MPALPVLLALVLLSGLIPGCCTPATSGTTGSDPPQADSLPRWYVAHRTLNPITIDGRLDEAAWRALPWTADFTDIEGERRPRPRFRTAACLAWDDLHLYVAARLEEPHVWGTLRQHDDIVFRDNDFEVFIDPDGDRHSYYEIEVNALNTIFDLLLARTYVEGGPALHEWNLEGLQSAVAVEGTLNDPADTDRGWTVEMALPWRALAEHTRSPAPPSAGDVWRMNFSRVEWQHATAGGAYQKIPDTPENNWVWSPQGAINMHLPHMWGYVEFAGELARALE
ncbi:MAG: carbohydrate-binding family 9-like protein [Planctomycetota bacterium]